MIFIFDNIYRIKIYKIYLKFILRLKDFNLWKS
jgi:hypothetical protein